jgi:hypothetical protein
MEAGQSQTSLLNFPASYFISHNRIRLRQIPGRFGSPCRETSPAGRSRTTWRLSSMVRVR